MAQASVPRLLQERVLGRPLSPSTQVSSSSLCLSISVPCPLLPHHLSCPRGAFSEDEDLPPVPGPARHAVNASKPLVTT